ncbi:MAG: hypothetical protein P1V97_17950 [Planctomycetota bacterium]|nr:hypothetical protein [Planctomycetota bacterium]
MKSLSQNQWQLLRSIIGVFLFSVLFHTAIEVQHEDLFGHDGYYHIKIAKLYSNGECSIFGGDFPWAAYSSYNDVRHDWQLGYHIALIPFTWFDLMVGAKASVVVFAAFLSTVIFTLFKIEKVRGAFPLTCLFLVSAADNIWRLHLPRPTTLFLAVFLITAFAASRRHLWGTFLGTLFSLWIYNVPHSLIALAGISVALVSWSDRQIHWKLFACFAAGFLCGIILHPGFWHWEGSFFGMGHGTFVLWEQINGTLAASMNGNQVLIDGASFPIASPAEFEDMEGRILKKAFSLPLIFLGLVILLKVTKDQKLSLLSQITMSVSVLFLWLFIDSARFAEYWTPFLFVGGGVIISDWFEGSEDRVPETQNRWSKLATVLEIMLLTVQALSLFWSSELYFAYGALALFSLRYAAYSGLKILRDGFQLRPLALTLVLLGGLGLMSVKGFENLKRTVNQWPSEQHRAHIYKGGLTWLEENSNAEDLVFHADWDDFAPMFFYNHKNRYLVSFDSYFFYQHDPRLYASWVEVSYKKISKEQIRDRLNQLEVQYLFIRLEDDRMHLVKSVRNLPEYQAVYVDKHAIVFKKKRS